MRLVSLFSRKIKTTLEVERKWCEVINGSVNTESFNEILKGNVERKC